MSTPPLVNRFDRWPGNPEHAREVLNWWQKPDTGAWVALVRWQDGTLGFTTPHDPPFGQTGDDHDHDYAS